MFSDSHCHLLHVSQAHPHFPLMLKTMQEDGFPFVMDIGTDAGDFTVRYSAVAQAWNKEGSIPDFIHFSAGLWPGKAAIAHREAAIAALEADIQAILKSGQQYTAIGECGIDRYWNYTGASGKGTSDLTGEETLFKAQLSLAKRYGLAVIIHSRDGFEPTLRCIDEVGWHKGVIHCFSYGKPEAEAFLERGWYLSFPGTITYSTDKKAALKTAELLHMMPADKLLLETDAPYLTPEPFRGRRNEPAFTRLVAVKMAEILNLKEEEVMEITTKNAKKIFMKFNT